MLAARDGVRVLPVGLSGTDRLLGKGRTWPRIGTRITIRVGAPFQVTLDPGLPRRQAMQVASDEVMRRISDLVDPRQRRPASRHGHRAGRPEAGPLRGAGATDAILGRSWEPWNRSGSHGAPDSAMGCARRSTTPGPRPPDGRETLTLGQTVHNEGVISDLQSRGIRTVDSLDMVEPGASVVIRAHGVTPDVMETAQRRGLDVIDGTCSWVVQEHREVARLVEEGYTIVLLGTPNHPEVVGILGYAPDAIVVDEEEEWDRIPRTKRMALVSQSTQPPWKFERLAAFMVSRCHELKIVNTVCPVTIRRQEDTIELAGQVDMMVVVGGRNSANTRELTRLVGIAHKPAVQVERAAELTDASDLRGVPHGRHHGRHIDPHRGPGDGHPARV